MLLSSQAACAAHFSQTSNRHTKLTCMNFFNFFHIVTHDIIKFNKIDEKQQKKQHYVELFVQM